MYANQLYEKFAQHFFSEAIQEYRDKHPELHMPTKDITVAEENKLTPVDGYLCLYSDLLGFSREIGETGFDPLPDFYGAALVSALQHPFVKVFLLSDSFIAFAHKEDTSLFLKYALSIFENWLADGMLPQCFLGYGSFVERRPFPEITPDNFFGTQITGTALVDAVNLQKNKPLGARILISESAVENMTEGVQLVVDENGNSEIIASLPKHRNILYCLYFILCLRSQESGSRAFKHYVWSAASRIIDGGDVVKKWTYVLAQPCFGEVKFGEISGEIQSVLEEYQKF